MTGTSTLLFPKTFLFSASEQKNRKLFNPSICNLVFQIDPLLGDREAKLKMVMNSLSQVLSLPIQQQKEVFKNNPILRQLLMKRNAG